MKYFAWPAVIGLAVLGALFFFTHNWTYVYEALVLSFIEVSMSFDNAVVNATKLQTMSHNMRMFFLWFGLPVAVFGMRFLLPVFMVAGFGHVSPSLSLDMALHDQAKFAHILSLSHSSVIGFGGTFLLATALEYFIDSEKDSHWLEPFEGWLANLDIIEKSSTILPALFTIIVTAIVAYTTTGFATDSPFLDSASTGLAVWLVVGWIKSALEETDNALVAKGAAIVSGGLGTLLYLEVLDASFSFDGVVAAFAISNDLIVVAIGLGIGALFIRSATIKLVEENTLNQFKYLENGAFWSIFALAAYMFAENYVTIPDWIIALTSIGLIVSSVVASIETKVEVTVVADGAEVTGSVKS
jgi:hypothetical protein